MLDRFVRRLTAAVTRIAARTGAAVDSTARAGLDAITDPIATNGSGGIAVLGTELVHVTDPIPAHRTNFTFETEGHRGRRRRTRQPEHGESEEEDQGTATAGFNSSLHFFLLDLRWVPRRSLHRQGSSIAWSLIPKRETEEKAIKGGQVVLASAPAKTWRAILGR